MADYNLGRAHGTIDIDYDSTGARRAQADMAATAAEAAALDAAMGRVNQKFDEHRDVEISTAEEIVRARGEVDQLRRAYIQYQEDYERAQRRVQEAADRASDAIRDQRDDLDALREARIALDRAEEDAERLRVRAAEGYEEYRIKLQAVRQEVDRFNAAHASAAAGFRNLSRDAERLGGVLESLEEKFSAVARVIGQIGLFGLLGGAAGGQLFATMAGGAQVLATALAAVVEVAQSFLGAIALIPAAVNAAVLGIGTLAVAFQGVGTALGAMGDPKKFVEAIRDLSPAAQQTMLVLQSFQEAFRGVRYELQESLFAPIVADIQPLVQTWLPQLMNAGKAIAGEFGESFHQVFQYFQTPEAQSSFQNFTQNMVTGFQAARGAIQPFLEAWNTLAEVGSDLFPRIGAAITDIAEKFNAWIQRTAANGQLSEFLNKALDGFTNMGRIIRDVAFGINNIFGVFENENGSALETIANLAEKFREWSDSVSGQTAIGGFFSLIKAAAEAVQPTLALLGDSFAIIGRTLTELGIAIQPGLASFFQSLKESLSGLQPYIVGLAPAINQFLAAFGQTLQQVILSIGPQLPELFADMSAAFVSLMQVIPPVASALASVLDHVTPETIMVFLGLVAALKALSATMTVVNIVMAANPFGLVAIAIAGLVAAGVLLVQNWDTVKQKAQETWDSISSGISNLWNSAYQWGRNLITNLTNGIADAARSIMEPVVDGVAALIPDFLKVSSPSKRGPLSEMAPEEMGARLVSLYAGGMSRATSSVTDASAGVAGQAAAIGAGGGFSSFSSAGATGRRGSDFSTGTSGFDQYIQFITKDLTAWNNIFQQAFNLVDGIGTIVENTVRLAANLVNGGDNALTRPGGLLGPPLPIAQQEVPGIQNRPIPGVAPDQWGRDLAAMNGLPGQQSVPGVPGRRESGAPSTAPPAPPAPAPTPTTPAPPPPPTTPATTTGAVPAAAPGENLLPNGWGSSQQEVANAIITEGKRRGWSDDLIRDALGTAVQESNMGLAARADGSDPRIPKGVPNGGFQPGPEGVGPMGEFGDYALGYFQQKPRYYPNWADPMGNIRGFMDNVDAQGGDIIGVQKGIYGLNDVQSHNVDQYMQNYRPPVPTAPTPPAGPRTLPPGTTAVSAGGTPIIGTKGDPAPPGGRRVFDAQDFGGINLLEDDEQQGGFFGSGMEAPRTRSTPPNAPLVGPSTTAPVQTPPPGGNAGPATQWIRGQGTYGRVDEGWDRTESGFPQWVYDLGAAFGIGPSTYGGHQQGERPDIGAAPNPENLNRGIDWWPIRNGKQYTDMSGESYTPEEVERLDAFAKMLQETGLAEMVIWQNPQTGSTVGFPQNVDYGSDYSGHRGHVHTRNSVPIIAAGQPDPATRGGGFIGSGIQGGFGTPPPQTVTAGGVGSQNPQSPANSSWMNVPDGWDLSNPIPKDVIRQNMPNLTDEQLNSLPPMYYQARPGTVENVPVPPDYKGNQPVSPGGTISVPTTTGAPVPGFPSTNDQRSPMDRFSDGMQSMSSIAGSAFTVFQDIIASIGAAANITKTLVRGFENSESVVNFIQQFQTFIKTGADVAKLVGDVGGIVGQAGAGDPTGGASAIGGGIQAVAGVVQGIFEATNAAITLGIDIYHQVGKYAGFLIGGFLGGDNTGPLGGNVRMLLNTRTNELMTYSENNPQNKNTFSIPKWMQSYDQQNQIPQTPATVNIYAGPGQTPQAMMQESMWLATSGAPSVMSAAGAE